MKSYGKENENISLQYFLAQIRSNWYIFAICLILFIAGAFAYTHYTTKRYLISSTMLLQPRPTTGSGTSEYANNGMTGVLNTVENIKNEGDVLRSRNLMKEVVQALQLNVRTYLNSGVQATEIYDACPFEVTLLRLKTDSVKKQEYKLTFADKQTLNLINEDEFIDQKFVIGKAIHLPQFDIMVSIKPNVKVTTQTYSIGITDEDDAVKTLLEGYDAEFIDKATTSVGFTFYYPNPERGELILQTLMNRYLQDNIINKKQIIDSSIRFIDQRIAVVERDLENTEQRFQYYRSNNSIADLDEQSKILVGNASDYANKSQQQRTQLAVINNLRNRLRNAESHDLIPVSLSIQDPSFTASLIQYNNLLTERTRKKLSLSEANPVIVNIDQQLQVVRQNMLQSIDSYQSELQLNSRGTSSQVGMLNSNMRNVPGQQRAMIAFSRQQQLKQQLYMYLLQKREETTMAKAAEIPYSRILDNAKSSKNPVKPVKAIVYTMAFFMGLVVPFGYINSKRIFNNKIISEGDIEKQTDVMIIGKIGHHALQKRNMAISSRSPVAESFRSLRIKLTNLLKKNSNVIMVTSSINGEGKTFLTWNLGSTLANAGKKVVILELDLRKPKLSSMLGIEHNDYGFSDYMLGNLDAKSIVKPSGYNENCSIISAGPLVEYPAELLLDDKLGELIQELRQEYDYVVVDSSPVGLVSDALLIQKHVDMTIYVCRHNYTSKAHIDVINEIKQKDKVDNIYLVINDVNYANAGYNGYGYGLGYNY